MRKLFYPCLKMIVCLFIREIYIFLTCIEFLIFLKRNFNLLLKEIEGKNLQQKQIKILLNLNIFLQLKVVKTINMDFFFEFFFEDVVDEIFLKYHNKSLI